MKLYRWLLRLYPARFREEYAAPLERQFADEYREARGAGARAAFWLRALADLATSIPAEFARELRQDLKYAARVYRARLFVTTLALAALALAIGVTTGVFSVVNALLIRSLPFRDPGRLMEISNLGIRLQPNGPASVDLPPNPGFDTATYISTEMNLRLTGHAAHVHVTEASADFFSLLGTEPQLGRGFLAGEDASGKDAVAVIGYNLWQQMFGGDPRVLGTTIHVNGAPLTVVGVAPPNFDYPAKTAIWAPSVFDFGRLGKDYSFVARTIARLRPGVTLARARAILEAMRSADPEAKGHDENRPRLVPLQDQLAGPVRQASLVLMAVVAFVLLIACANVAQLLLSRITDRRHEMAVRAALGASRARLVQQLVTESIMLTLTAAIAGLGVAYWTSRLASSVQPPQLTSQSYSIGDWRVLSFATAVALLTGAVFGVLPAWLTGGASRMRTVLVAVQAALTVALLAGSLTMGRSFLKLMGSDLSFRTRNVVTATASLYGSRYEKDHHSSAYFGQVLDRLRRLPGVESAGGADYVPLNDQGLLIIAAKLDSGQEADAVPINVTPGYFRSIGAGIVAGRDFTDADREGAELVAVVNEEFARQTGVSVRLLGRTMNTWFDKKPRKIVGVVRTMRFSPSMDRQLAQFYLPMAQHPAPFMTVVARVRGSAAPYVSLVRDTIREVDPQVAVYGAMTLDARLDEALARPRFYTTAVLFRGGFAVLLAVIGIYGVAAYSIAQRTHEIGVRMAIGATPQRLRVALLRSSMLPIAVGMAAGVACALELGRFLEHLVSGAEPVGTRTCTAAALLLAIIAVLAVWRATARVLRVDPMRALRAE